MAELPPRINHITDTAARVDRDLTTVLEIYADAGHSPAEIMAGAVFAVVRQLANTMAGPRTVRQLMSLLLPAINHAAEQACNPTTPKADA